MGAEDEETELEDQGGADAELVPTWGRTVRAIIVNLAALAVSLCALVLYAGGVWIGVFGQHWEKGAYFLVLGLLAERTGDRLTRIGTILVGGDVDAPNP